MLQPAAQPSRESRTSSTVGHTTRSGGSRGCGERRAKTPCGDVGVLPPPPGTNGAAPAFRPPLPPAPSPAAPPPPAVLSPSGTTYRPAHRELWNSCSQFSLSEPMEEACAISGAPRSADGSASPSSARLTAR
jgi:hypothetical protein